MNNFKIGLTIGIFDLLHQGHINFLKESKKKCDYLIVGLCNDYITRIQKGHDRPYESLEQRYCKLQESNLCDKIIIIDTLDMSQYLQICDVWIKGSEQKNMKPFDFKNIIVIPRTPNISTTKIIQDKKIKIKD